MRGRRVKSIRRAVVEHLAADPALAARVTPRALMSAAVGRCGRRPDAGKARAASRVEAVLAVADRKRLAKLAVKLARQKAATVAEVDHYALGYDAALCGRGADPPDDVVLAGAEAESLWRGGHADFWRDQPGETGA